MKFVLKNHNFLKLVDLDLMFLNFAVKLCLAKTGLETGQEIANQRKD